MILQHVNHTLIIRFYVLFVIHNPTVLVSLGNFKFGVLDSELLNQKLSVRRGEVKQDL